MEQRYRIVFINDLDHNADLDKIKTALVERFKLSDTVVRVLLTKDSTIVKDNLDGETAALYKMAIDATGANCRIEPMPVTSIGTNVRERRRNSRRNGEISDRRKTLRGGSIQPDRRVNKDRRRQVA